MKAIMKTAPATPLYVRNFRHYRGPEAAMKARYSSLSCIVLCLTQIQIVFEKARQNSPCLLVLEDLDSLVTRPSALTPNIAAL